MVSVNFVTDCGAPINGTSSCDTAMGVWLATAIANDGSTLTIPSYNGIGVNSPYHLATLNGFGNGVKNCTITAQSGASVDTLFIGHAGCLVQDFTHSARIVTTTASATSVTLVTVADASRFSVNQWIMISGLGIQAGASYPPNFEFLEFRQITGIVGGVISFTAPLTYIYRSTWPEVDQFPVSINIGTSTFTSIGPVINGTSTQNAYFTTTGSLPTGITAGTGYFIVNASGANFQVSTTSGGAPISLSGTQSGTHYFHSGNYDVGGPATIYALTAEFDGTQVWSGLKVTAGSTTPIFCGAGQSMTLDTMDFSSNLGPAPSMGLSMVIQNSAIGIQNEVDKCLESLTYDNCTGTQIQCQSASPNLMIVKGGTVVSAINGTPYATDLRDTSNVGTLIMGATGFGRSSSLTYAPTVTIAAIDPSSGTRVSAHFIDPAEMSFSNGVFSIANSANLFNFTRLWVPGFFYVYGYTAASQIVITDDVGGQVYFRCLDMTQDATNIYVTTNLVSPPSHTYQGNNANAIFAYAFHSITPTSSALIAVPAAQEPLQGSVGLLSLRLRR